MRISEWLAVGLCGVLAVAAAQGQGVGFTSRKDAAEVPSYEVVSIHKTKDENAKLDYHDDPDGYTAVATSLRRLIAEAYGFSLGQVNDHLLVGGPDWIKTQPYDVHAKVDPADVAKVAALEKADTMMEAVREMTTRTPSYRMVMLQRLLEDRFHVKIHYEQRVMPVYEMVADKGGLKMKVAHPADPAHGSMSISNGEFTGENVPVAFIPYLLALAAEVKRPVLDKTGNNDNVDFDMKYAPMGDTTSQNAGLFTALQEQLGVKLQSSKQQVWVVVIDHVELPTEN